MIDQTYISVCDGIGAIHVAAQLLGWRCKWTSEIEPFPAAVVEHHWQLPNLGDMLAITEKDIDEHGRARLLVGGTPCQSFSVAGLRGGLDDPRGNLALRFVQLADVIRPQWVLWENVPGVLSSGGGRDFGSIVGALAKLGYGWAYRILDAQFFGVPQRRRRVFLVGHLGDWRRAATVLFERHGLQGHTAPSREARQSLTHDVAQSLVRSGRGVERAGDTRGQDPVIACVAGSLAVANAEGSTGLPFLTKCNIGKGVNNQTPLAYTLRGESLAASLAARHDGSPCTDRGPDVVFSIQERAVSENLAAGTGGKGYQPDKAYTLEARNKVQSVAFTQNQAGDVLSGPVCPSIGTSQSATGRNTGKILTNYTVRRLTPRECERLQGFPDDYTIITYKKKPAADGPRYRALGNSMAVPVMRWIMERIGQVDQITAQSSKDAA